MAAAAREHAVAFAQVEVRMAVEVRPRVGFDNKASGRFTVIEVNAQDRPALLNQLAYALFQSKVTVHSAHVATYGERAVDTFYVTDLIGDKIDSPARAPKTAQRASAPLPRTW